jgi:hypothetical protein
VQSAQANKRIVHQRGVFGHLSLRAACSSFENITFFVVAAHFSVCIVDSRKIPPAATRALAFFAAHPRLIFLMR